MIDPVTALATATSAFNLIKKGFSVGKDIESMGQDLGRWMGAMSDLKKAEDRAKDPPLLRKLAFAKSIEEEAMQVFMAKKKAEDMREQLKQLIILTRGMNAWDELIRMEGQIRKERQEAIYAQKEKREKLIEIVLATLLIAGAAAVLIGIMYFAVQARGA